jgi:hypothetical protein
MRRWQRLVHLVVGMGLLVSLLPAAAPVAIVAAPQSNETEPIPPAIPNPITVPPLNPQPEPPRPTLDIALDTGPDPLVVGATVAVTLTVRTATKLPAADVVIRLPLPDGVVFGATPPVGGTPTATVLPVTTPTTSATADVSTPIPADGVTPTLDTTTTGITATTALPDGTPAPTIRDAVAAAAPQIVVDAGRVQSSDRDLTWTIGDLPGETAQTLTATIQITRRLPGDAVFFVLEATLRDSPPIPVRHGAVVLPPETPATARFNPGQTSTLRSDESRIVVTTPPTLRERPLTLRYRPLADALDSVRGFPLRGPSPLPFSRDLGIFILDAADDQGSDVRQ